MTTGQWFPLPLYEYQCETIKERKDFAIIEFSTRGLRTSLEEILAMDSYEVNDEGVYNFMMKLSRKGAGTDTVYTLTPAPLKAPARAAVTKKWNEIKEQSNPRNQRKSTMIKDSQSKIIPISATEPNIIESKRNNID